MAYENVERVRQNLITMVDKNAPVNDINKYLKEEGFTQDSFAKTIWW